MRRIKASILAVSVLALTGTAGAAVDWTGICCDGGYEYRHPNGWELELQRLKDELAARDREIASLRSGSSDTLRSAQADLDRSKARTAELERQLADRDREMASLRSSAGDSSKLANQLTAANSDLAAANQRNSALEAQLAAMSGAGASAAELAAAKQRVAELERQLADRDKQLAGLQGDLSAEMAKLKEAQRGLVRALRPQIEKGDITVDLNNERLLINLASNYLFGTGEDALKPAGANALKQVGAVLKDFPEYKVAVDGHTDSVAIRTSLKKRFPTNKELSEARAANAARSLTEGGRGDATTTGYADTRPVEPNTTAEGRAKNRRVEIRVTR